MFACAKTDFDFLAIMFVKPVESSNAFDFGIIATGSEVAGGRKVVILLFQGIFGFGNDAVEARIEARLRFEQIKCPGNRGSNFMEE